MARIFSINFIHNGSPETAIVTVREENSLTEYEISISNQAIADQLPSNTIIASKRSGFHFLKTSEQKNTILMNDLLKAVQEHIQSLAV